MARGDVTVTITRPRLAVALVLLGFWLPRAERAANWAAMRYCVRLGA